MFVLENWLRKKGLGKNPVYILQISVDRTLLILVNIGWIVFIKRVQKRILIHYGLQSQILKRVLVSKRGIRLSSNLVCILQVAVGRTLLILVNIGCIVFLQEQKKELCYLLQTTMLVIIVLTYFVQICPAYSNCFV